MPEKRNKQAAEKSPWKNRRLIDSFKAASFGFLYFFKERNIKIISTIGLLVLMVGIALKISIEDFCILLLLIATTTGFEIINTSIEHLSDLIELKFSKYVKIIKDLSASVVLLFSVVSIIIGILIFHQYLF